jgi:uncharacterized protein (TIGR02598 family)
VKFFNNRNRGFSLVEVVVALGLFSFCVVAITGFLAVGIGSARSVVNEGAASNIAESIYGAWQVQSSGTQPLTVEGLFANLPALSTTGSHTFYFDAYGQQVENPAEAAFEVSYITAASGIPPRINTELSMIFQWPVRGATNAIQTRRFSRVFVK